MQINIDAPIVDSSAPQLSPSDSKATASHSEHSMRLEKYLPSVLVSFMRGKARAAFYQYALVAALIAVVCITALLALGKSP